MILLRFAGEGTRATRLEVARVKEVDFLHPGAQQVLDVAQAVGQ